ncbi:alpha/beta hydrolase [Schleiferilactobacillus harbinensis]|uniref:alpha/beta hydrolase n=1 Tax=Schleiferilactobacillus harbinensis TaxID=304207 RepID=UPI003870ED44
MAGPFNDIELGKDTDEILVYEWGPRGPFRQAPIYHYIAEKVHDLPRDIHILNIAGDIFTIPTRHDDGVIAVQSAFALRWLLPKAGIDYQEVLIRGVRGAHSLLHENKLVDDNIVRFLYAS